MRNRYSVDVLRYGDDITVTVYDLSMEGIKEIKYVKKITSKDSEITEYADGEYRLFRDNHPLTRKAIEKIFDTMTKTLVK